MKKLPESEQEIMMIIWEYEEPVSRFQVEEKLNVEKNVAPSTILTSVSYTHLTLPTNSLV